MRHLFIVNPVAGGKKNKHKQMISYIRSVMDAQPEPYEIYITQAPMDACDKIRQEAQSPEPLRVYACGGDGTLNECVNGAIGFEHITLTSFPCGTGNDFIRTFGKNAAERFRDLKALLGGFAHPIDLIEVQAPGITRYGINICSVGIDARIGADIHRYSSIPIIGGATGYVVSMLVNLIRGVNQRLTIKTETGRSDGSFALLCACNGRYYGGGFNPVPDAMPDDGILDFLIVKAVSRMKFIALVGKYAKGRYKEIDDIIAHIRGNTMQIDSENTLLVNIDGEVLSADHIIFKTVPGGVSFIFPPDTRFFDSAGHLYNDISSYRKI